MDRLQRFRKSLRLKISSKVALSFIILVILQGVISLLALTAIVSRSQNDSFQAQMNRAFLGSNAYLEETLDKLMINTNLLAGQKKVIDYTDFGLRNLLNRELAVYHSSLQMNSLAIYIQPDILFTSVGDMLLMNNELRENLKVAFAGEKSFFVSESGIVVKLTMLSPIKREEKIIGVLGLSLNLDQSFVQKLENITNSKIIFLFNEKIIEAGNLKSETHKSIIAADHDNSLSDKMIKIDNFMVGSIYIESFRGSNGKILCLLDTKESRLIITRYNTISLVSTLLILSLALLIAMVFYRVTFFRPFQTLLKGVHKISLGDLHYHFQVPAEDEFGELASAFNKMRGNLLNRERELLQLSHYNNLILENVRSGIITINLELRITTYNPAAEKIIGLEKKDFRGTHIKSKSLPGSLFNLIRESLNKDMQVTGEEVRITRNGMDLILFLSTSPLFSREGQKIGIIAIFEDITRVRKLEEKLVISSRLAALGEMAAGVAHQIRNPLGVMKVSAEMLRDDFSILDKKDNYNRITHMIINEIDTLNLVIRNLLDFARPREIQKNLCSIRAVIDQSLNSLPLDKYPELEIDTVIRKETPEYLMDKSLIEQVISNLVLNAIQASAANGKIEIRVFLKNEHMCLEIQDWGSGFDERIRQQIFNPFFTTKATGTGLGLSIGHRIIEQHNGSIEVISEPGKGSTFRIIF